MANPPVKAGDLIIVTQWYSNFANARDKEAWGSKPIPVTEINGDEEPICSPLGAGRRWIAEEWHLASSGSTSSNSVVHSMPADPARALPKIDQGFTGITVAGLTVSVIVYKISHMEFWDEIHGENADGVHTFRLERI